MSLIISRPAILAAIKRHYGNVIRIVHAVVEAAEVQSPKDRLVLTMRALDLRVADGSFTTAAQPRLFHSVVRTME